MNKLIFGTFLVLFIAATSAINFDYNLKPKEMQCFGEALEEKVLVVLEVFAQNPNIVVRIYDQTGQLHQSFRN